MNKKLFLIVLSYLVIIFEVFISFFYNPIFFRLISIEEFGKYNYLLSLVSYFSLLNIGLGGTYLRFFYKLDKNDYDYNFKLISLNNSFIHLLKSLTVLGMFFLFGFLVFTFLDLIPFISVDLILPFIVLVIIELTNIYSVFMNGIIFTHNKLIFLKVISFLFIILRPSLTITFILIEPNIISLVISSFIFSLVTILIKIFFINRNKLFQISKSKVNSNSFFPILSFSALVLVNMVVDTFTYSIGKTIIGLRSSLSSVSLYSISIQLVIYFITLSTIVNEVFITQVHSHSNSSQKLYDFHLLNVVSIYKLSILSFLLVGFFFYGELFLAFWTNNKLIDAYFSTMIYLTALLIPISQNLVIEYLKSRNKYFFKTIVSVISLILFIVLSLFSVSYLDFYGPIVSISIVLFIFNVIILNIYYKKLGIDFTYYWRTFLLKIIPTNFLIISLSYIVKGYLIPFNIVYLNSIFQVLVISSIYVILFLFFILEKNEKRRVMTFIRKLL